MEKKRLMVKSSLYIFPDFPPASLMKAYSHFYYWKNKKESQEEPTGVDMGFWQQVYHVVVLRLGLLIGYQHPSCLSEIHNQGGVDMLME